MQKGICELFPQGSFAKGERVDVDCSTGEPELETHHKTLAVEDMGRVNDFLNAVAKQELSVENLKEISVSVAELSKALPDIKALADAMRKPSTKPERREIG